LRRERGEFFFADVFRDPHVPESRPLPLQASQSSRKLPYLSGGYHIPPVTAPPVPQTLLDPLNEA